MGDYYRGFFFRVFYSLDNFRLNKFRFKTWQAVERYHQADA